MNENIQINKQAELLFESENVKNLSEFKEKIKTECLPHGFVSVEEGSSIFYHYIKSSANTLFDAPKLLGTVIVTDQLEVQMFVSSTFIPKTSYHHLLQSSSSTSIIKTTTELLNLLSFCKCACDRSTDFTANTCIALVISLLTHYIHHRLYS